MRANTAPSRTPTVRWWTLLAPVLLTAALCEPGADIIFDNQTDQPIQIVAIGGSGREIIIAEIQPGDRAFSRDECIDPDLTALTLDGIVLAQRPGPICQGDDPWVITDNTSTTS